MAKKKKSTQDLIYVVMMEIGCLLAHFGWDIKYRIFDLEQPAVHPVKEATRMFVIINDGVCCHYQIEGGVFTTREAANAFADGRVDEGTTRDQLRVVPVAVDPDINDFPLDTINRRSTAIWPRKGD